MDLNQLLGAHQRALMENRASSDKTADRAHAERIAGYADRIKRLRDHHASESTDEIETWESEGGAMSDPGTALPPGVILTWRLEYRVGSYIYSDLALAMAELERQKKCRAS